MKLLGAALMLVGLACAGGAPSSECNQDNVEWNSSKAVPGLEAIGTTPVMLGMGVYFTPKTTGRVLVLMSGTIGNFLANTTVIHVIVYGTGPKPPFGPGSMGTTAGAARSICPQRDMEVVGFHRSVVIEKLAVGTQYWVDLRMAATKRDDPTASGYLLDGLDIVIQEI